MAAPAGGADAAAVARHAAALRQSNLSVLQARCSSLSNQRVAVFDESSPAVDFRRWHSEIMKVATVAGKDFYAALFAASTTIIPRTAVANVLDVDDFGLPQPPEMRQLALRTLIGHSISPGGEAHKLIMHKPHAGGGVNAVGAPDVHGDALATERAQQARGAQSWQVLCERFLVPETPEDKGAQATSLLTLRWPTTGLSADYQLHLSKVERMATELGLDDNDALRKLWWPLVAEPSSGSPYAPASSRARLSTAGARDTIAHRRAYVAAFLDELQIDERARLRAGLPAAVCEPCVDEECFDADAVSAGRYQRGGPSRAQTSVSTVPRRPCVRCNAMHPRGFKCVAVCQCGVCGSDKHCEPSCWVKHGPAAMLYSLPVHVALQFNTWHEQYKTGTYKQMTGGPVVAARDTVLGRDPRMPGGANSVGVSCGGYANSDVAAQELVDDQVATVAAFNEALAKAARDAAADEAEQAAQGVSAAVSVDMPEVQHSTCEQYLSQFGAAPLDTKTVATCAPAADAPPAPPTDGGALVQLQERLDAMELSTSGTVAKLQQQLAQADAQAETDRLATELRAELAQAKAEREQAKLERRKYEAELEQAKLEREKYSQAVRSIAEAERKQAELERESRNDASDALARASSFADAALAGAELTPAAPPCPAPVQSYVGPLIGAMWVMVVAAMLVRTSNLLVDSADVMTHVFMLLVTLLLGGTVFWVLLGGLAAADARRAWRPSQRRTRRPHGRWRPSWRGQRTLPQLSGVLRGLGCTLLTGVNNNHTTSINFAQQPSRSSMTRQRVSHSLACLLQASHEGLCGLVRVAPVALAYVLAGSIQSQLQGAGLHDTTLGLLEPSASTLRLLQPTADGGLVLDSCNVGLQSRGAAVQYSPTFQAASTDLLYDTGTVLFILDGSHSRNVQITRSDPPLRVRVADGRISPVASLVTCCVTFETSTGYASVLAPEIAVVPDFPRPLWSHAYAGEVLDIQAHFGSRSHPASFATLPDDSTFAIGPPPYHFRVAFTHPAAPRPGPGLAKVRMLGGVAAVRRVESTDVPTPGASPWCGCMAVSPEDAWLWHNRLMHKGPSGMSYLCRHVDGTPLDGPVRLSCKCHVCMENKSRRSSLHSHAIVANVIGATTHSDWVGPLVEDLYFGCRYACCFVDDKSRFKWVFFTKDRTWESYQMCFSGWCAILAKYGFTVASLLTDQGPELVSADAFDFMDTHAIERALSCRYRQAQDGVAESVWRVAFADVRASVNSTITPKLLRRRMWALALHQRVNIIGNGMPTAATNASPHFAVTDKKLNLKHLKTMFCAAAAHVPIDTREEHHTDRVARMGVHCGQSSLYKGYIIYFPDTHTFDHCVDVEFDESSLPLLELSPSPPPLPPPGPMPPLSVHLQGTLVPPPPASSVPPRSPHLVPHQLVAVQRTPATLPNATPLAPAPVRADQGAQRALMMDDGVQRPAQAPPAQLAPLVQQPPPVVQAAPTLLPVLAPRRAGSLAHFDARGSNATAVVFSVFAACLPQDGEAARAPDGSRAQMASSFEAGWLAVDAATVYPQVVTLPNSCSCGSAGVETTWAQLNTCGGRADSCFFHVACGQCELHALPAPSTTAPAAPPLLPPTAPPPTSPPALPAHPVLAAVDDTSCTATHAPWPLCTAPADAFRVQASTRWVGSDDNLRPLNVPNGWRAMLRDDNSSHWQAGALREMQSQWECETWRLVARSDAVAAGKQVISCRWVFDAKIADFMVAVWKARLVARGFEQVEGEDFFDWYFGAVRPSTVRFFFAVSAHYGLRVYQADVCTAYLNASLDDVVVYMEQPEGFERKGPNGEHERDTVCLLQRALYGLRQSARQWGMTLLRYMSSLGFTRGGADSQLFVLRRDGAVLLVAVCVDDLLMAASSDALRVEFMGKLGIRFKIKDVGEAQRAIGFGIDQSPDRTFIKLHLSTYIATASARFQLDVSGGAHDMPAPLSMVRACAAAHPTDAEVAEVVETYTSLVGALIFITTYVRVDAVASVHILTRYMGRPGHLHLRLAMRVLQYLYHTRTYGLTYRRGDSFDVSAAFVPETKPAHGLHAGSDSDWAVGPSCTAFVIMMCGAAVGWAARLQRCSSLSSAEAEFYALSEAVAETVHFRNLLAEIGVVLDSPTVIYCDSRGARLMAMDLASSKRTRHIHRRWYFVAFYVEEGQVLVVKLDGSRNFADCLSKATGGKLFAAQRAYLLGV